MFYVLSPYHFHDDILLSWSLPLSLNTNELSSTVRPCDIFVLGEVKCVWNRARSLITAVLYSIRAILIWLVGQLLCTLRLLYPFSASLARVAFTLPFFIFTILTLWGKYFSFTCLSTVWKFFKLVGDKTFGAIRELGIKLARGLFVVIFFTFWFQTKDIIISSQQRFQNL